MAEPADSRQPSIKVNLPPEPEVRPPGKKILADSLEEQTPTAEATPEEQVADTVTAAHTAVNKDVADLKSAAVPVENAANSVETGTLQNIKTTGEAAGVAAHSAIADAATNQKNARTLARRMIADIVRDGANAGIPHDDEVKQQEKVILTAGWSTVASEEHPNRNEDNAIVDRQNQLYGVFDGMSLPLGGEIAANLAASEVKKKFLELPPDSSVDELKVAMRRIIEYANKAIYNSSENIGKGASERIGTTATIAKVWRAPDGKRKLVIGHVGDSRAYLQYPDGRFEQLTMDDSGIRASVGDDRWKEIQRKFASIKNRAELNDEEKLYYRLINQITVALGTAETIDPQIIVVDFPPGARLLLTTDGVHDPLTDSAMADILKNNRPGDAPYNLVDQAKQACAAYRAAQDAGTEPTKLPRGKAVDDKTAIVVELTPLILNPEATPSVAATPDYSLRQLLNEQKIKEQLKDGEATALQAALEQARFAFSSEIGNDLKLMTALREAMLAALTSKEDAVSATTLDTIAIQTGLTHERIKSILAALQLELDDQAKAASRESLKKVLGITALKVAAVAGVSTLAALGGVIPVGFTLAGLATARVLDNWRVHGKQKRQIKAAKAVIQANLPEHYLKNFAAMLAQAKQVEIDQPAVDDWEYIEEQLKRQLTEAHPEMTNEDRDRLVNATLALAQLDINSQELEDYSQSQPDAWDKLTGYMEKAAHKILPAGSLAEKNLTTVTFAAMGYVAREVPILRNILTGIAGFRLGGAATGWMKSKIMSDKDHRFISAEMLQKEFDSFNFKYKDLARIRAQLTDPRWQRQSADLQRLRETLDKVEQKIIVRHVEKAIDEVNSQTDGLADKLRWLQKDKRKSRILAVAGRVVGGAIGAMLPELIHSLSDHAPAADVSHQTSIAAESPTPIETLPPAAEPPTPEPSTPAVAAEPPAPTAPAPAAAASAAPPVETAPIGQPTVIKGDQGLSHGLAGKVSASEMNQLLHNTTVRIDGHEVTLADTGVAKAGTLEVAVGQQDGHNVVQLLDAKTHAQIAPEKLDDYLYDRSSGTGSVHTPHVEASSHVDHAVEPAPVTHDAGGHTDDESEAAVSPEQTPVARSGGGYEIPKPAVGETSDQFIARNMRELVNSRSDYEALRSLTNAELVNRPELSIFHDRFVNVYRSSLAPAPELAGEAASTVAETPAVLVEHGHLTEAGKQELNLAKHFNATGESESYTTFKDSIINLLEQSRDYRVRTPNGLMFEVKSGQLYVDVAGGGREAYLVDDKLYDNLMRGYQEIVKPTTGGKFTPELFYQTLDIADVEHTLHNFELERMNLNHFLDKGQPIPYSHFTDQIRQFMSDHNITTFTGPNNLVFRLDKKLLFVDLAGGAVRNFPLTEKLYTDLLERYQALGDSYHEKFDVDQFYDVVKKQ